MIKDLFIITDTEFKLRINIGLVDTMYDPSDLALAAKVLNSPSNGVSWNYNGKEVKLYKDNESIFAYPAIGLEYMIVIYEQEDDIYQAPRNAVIYKGNGEVHLRLTPPELISKFAEARKPYMDYNAPYRLWFNNIYWGKNAKGELVNIMTIGFDREWYEKRVLDPVTGEFGELVGFGRF